MIFICVSLALSRRARSSLYCSSFAVPSGKAYIPYFDGSRRIIDTLSIANDLCAFRSASLMLPGLARINARSHLVIVSSPTQPTSPSTYSPIGTPIQTLSGAPRPCSGAGRKLTLRGFTHPQLQRMDDDLGGLTRPRCTSDGHITH
ncbi:hypothetical protein DFP72DRAFT_903127 [Ephemerocybe angulata]|uniref:Uncharacterized protein n=1 Tax=Ephemerocybe angulata TaxID=980116 RepID=A0A8H6M6D0_9AGAR|nr:hypothetical protein DFP72DRAFT_903127 [Tulosesus angulatus]